MHYSTRSLSALYDLPTLADLEASYTPELFSQLRLALFGTYADVKDGKLALIDIPRALVAQADDDSALVGAIPKHKQSLDAFIERRRRVLACIRVLLAHANIPPPHAKKLGWSNFVAGSLDIEPPYSDWNSGRATMFVHTPTTSPAKHLATLLRHAAAAVPGERVASFAAEMQTCTRMHFPPDRNGADRAGEWIAGEYTCVSAYSAVCEKAPTSLGASIWAYDFAEPLSAVLHGAARASVLFALDAPTETLASMCATLNGPSGQRELDANADWPELAQERTDVHTLRSVRSDLDAHDIPDVCRLYQLYRDTSRFINLADWFDAFVYTVERSERRMHGTKRPKTDSNTRDLQLRFALGINELAHMGLLGPTGRKVDHLLRIVWDITVDPLPESS